MCWGGGQCGPIAVSRCDALRYLCRPCWTLRWRWLLTQWPAWPWCAHACASAACFLLPPRWVVTSLLHMAPCCAHTRCHASPATLGMQVSALLRHPSPAVRTRAVAAVAAAARVLPPADVYARLLPSLQKALQQQPIQLTGEEAAPMRWSHRITNSKLHRNQPRSCYPVHACRREAPCCLLAAAERGGCGWHRGGGTRRSLFQGWTAWAASIWQCLRPHRRGGCKPLRLIVVGMLPGRLSPAPSRLVQVDDGYLWDDADNQLTLRPSAPVFSLDLPSGPALHEPPGSKGGAANSGRSRHAAAIASLQVRSTQLAAQLAGLRDKQVRCPAVPTIITRVDGGKSLTLSPPRRPFSCRQQMPRAWKWGRNCSLTGLRRFCTGGSSMGHLTYLWSVGSCVQNM